jgi:hypothetical protein
MVNRLRRKFHHPYGGNAKQNLVLSLPMSTYLFSQQSPTYDKPIPSQPVGAEHAPPTKATSDKLARGRALNVLLL